MASLLNVIALVGAVFAAVIWIVTTIRHRNHLSQCVQDLRRHRRLNLRLIGCVNDIERILDRLPA
jgi:hypothetical protein